MNIRIPAVALLLILTLTACTASAAEDLQQPLDHASRRSTPLSFGMKVAPDQEHNPIHPPERFSGYHVATDFEVMQEELEADVPVYAICSGKILFSGFAEGYGGVIVQRCTIRKNAVTVVYGHLTLTSLPKKNARLNAGYRLALLAPARSHDSDGNRKHLHLGIHRGTSQDLRGYVQTEQDLSEYIDPLTVLPQSLTERLLPRLTPYWEVADQETGS